MTDPKVTLNEKNYYIKRLTLAAHIVNEAGLIHKDITGEETIGYEVLVAVFGKIASPLHFLRQEQDTRIPSDKAVHPKPSRIPLESTPWRASTSPWGDEQEGCSEDKLIGDDRKILADLKLGAFKKVKHGGWEYTANQSKKNGVWYLNRRRQK